MISLTRQSAKTCYTTYVPTAELRPVPWRYTTGQPDAGWQQIRFDDTPWATGKGGRWWATFFGNDPRAPFRERPAILRITLTPAGRITPPMP